MRTDNRIRKTIGKHAPVSNERRPRGFAYLKIHNPELLKNICSKGGKAAHEKGVAHEWDSEQAREAGRKGGYISHQNRKIRSES